jgi:hypothetical protein
LVSYIKGRTQAQGVSEQCTENTVCQEVTERWIVFRREICNFFFPPDRIRVMKSKELQWVGHNNANERKGKTRRKFWLGNFEFAPYVLIIWNFR